MKIFILDQLLEYENRPELVKPLLKEIDYRILKSNCLLSHLRIDEMDIYNDFEHYFSNHIYDIHEVHVVVKTKRELLYETIITSVDYLNRVIPEVESLAKHFYDTPSKKTWMDVISLFEGVKWLIESFTLINENDGMYSALNDFETWTLYSKEIASLGEVIKELEVSLQNEDYLMIADLLSYEMCPIFKRMREKLKRLVVHNYKEKFNPSN